MDSMEALASRLVGTWHAVAEWDESNVVYMRILEDLRYIGVFERQPVSAKWPWQSMCVWMLLEPNSVLRCSYRRGGSPMMRTFFFESDCFMLDVTSITIEEAPALERKLYRCRPIAVQDLPDGVEEEFSRAMAQEWT